MGKKTTLSPDISLESPSGQNTTPVKSPLPLVLKALFILFLFIFGGIFLVKYLYTPQTAIKPTSTPKIITV